MSNKWMERAERESKLAVKLSKRVDELEAALATQPTEARQSCVGYDGGCDGDLPGEAHSPKCPLYDEAAWKTQGERLNEMDKALRAEARPESGLDELESIVAAYAGSMHKGDNLRFEGAQAVYEIAKRVLATRGTEAERLTYEQVHAAHLEATQGHGLYLDKLMAALNRALASPADKGEK